MKITVEVLEQDWTIDTADLSDYMQERLFAYGLKQILQDVHATKKSDGAKLMATQARYNAIISDDRDAWREGSGGGKPLDDVTHELRTLVKKRADDLKLFSTTAARDKAVVANIETVYGFIAVRTIAGLKQVSEKHAAEAFAELCKAYAEKTMEADVEKATATVAERQATIKAAASGAADLVAELEASLKTE